MIWYNTFKTLVHAERINTYKSGKHYTIIIQVFLMHILLTCLGKISKYKEDRAMRGEMAQMERQKTQD